MGTVPPQHSLVVLGQELGRRVPVSLALENEEVGWACSTRGLGPFSPAIDARL